MQMLACSRQAVLLALMLAAACLSPTDPFDDIDVTIAVAPTVVRLDAPVTVAVSVINSSPRMFFLSTNPCPVRFEVATRTGMVVGPALQICALIAMPSRGLAPGERFVFTASWDGRGREGPLPVGEYRIRGVPFGRSGPHGTPVVVTLQE